MEQKMNTGIELVLARMESHPEEFVGVNGGCSKEWYAVMTPVLPYLTDEEKEALNSALKQAHLDHFNAQVLKKIAGESVLSDRDLRYTEDYYGRSLTDVINNGINGTTGVTLSTNNLIRNQIATMPSAFGSVPIKAEGAQVAYANGSS